MAELFDEDFFNKRQAALKKQAGSRWLTVLFVIIIVLALVGAWYWWSKNNPETMVFDINKASVEQLQYLPEVGPVLARDIVNGRPYTTIDDLKKVKGVGEKTFLKIKPRVKVE